MKQKIRLQEPQAVVSRQVRRDAIAPPTAEPMPPKAQTQSSSKRWRRGLTWGLLFGIGATTSAVLGTTLAMVSPLPQDLQGFLTNPEAIANLPDLGTPGKNAWASLLQYKIERPINILVMGIDRVSDVEVGSEAAFEGHSDTMLLVRFDPQNNSLSLLSIPRDTQVYIPTVGIAKINDANVYGGADLAMETVEETLNEVPIDRYVRVTNDAFRELVDLVGGVEVYVPHPMKYTDVTQQLEIDLDPGLQTLNGSQAEQFARFRMDEYGDIGRVQRQQILLKALRQNLQSPTVLPKIPQAVQLMQQFVDTNLSVEEMLALVGFGLHLEKEDIKMVMLPGRFSNVEEFDGISYWIMSHRDRDRVMQEYFNVESDREFDLDLRSFKRVRIAIQNTTDDPEVAQQALDYLRERNFRNVYVSPRQLTQPDRTTEIIVQQGNTAAAKMLQESLGLGRIEADSTGDLGSDLTLRIGTDWYSKRLPMTPDTPDEELGEESEYSDGDGFLR
ncbi:MAG: LCP family protein [Spirulinaceae cyanobacterium]